MITIESVSRTYGDFTVVDDVSFTAKPGRVTGFLGPNGAGKSTTMRIIVGLTQPTPELPSYQDPARMRSLGSGRCATRCGRRSAAPTQLNSRTSFAAIPCARSCRAWPPRDRSRYSP
jgi:ABC-type uncharacterized transport system ATPase subunit